MRKIPCLFERDFTDRRRPVLLNTITPGCEWVVFSEGRATRKRDGTACMVLAGVLYKRYDAKRGKTPPPGAIPCTPAPDPATGHWPHWVAVSADNPADVWHLAARDDAFSRFPYALPDGTYELCGPRINANHEGLSDHRFFAHGLEALDGAPREFDRLRDYLAANPIEGIVWHHPDGRMAKIRRADYWLPWPVAGERNPG